MAKGIIEAMLHTGNAIWFIAQLYDDPMVVVSEMVQNALDKQATKICVEIHTEKPARIAVYDNGLGASIEEIEEKFRNICQSFKTDDPDAIGEKGIGNLAGIAISEEYYLISRPKGTRNPYFKVSLKRDKVIDQPAVTIPWETITDVKLKPGFYTLVMLKRISPSVAQSVGKLDALAGEIAGSYSEQIRKRNVEIILEKYVRGGCAERKKVEAQEFPGQKQETITVDTEFGPVLFDLYTTITAQKQPELFVVHKGKFSFPLTGRKIRFLPAVCQTVFRSGYFQGYIRLDFGTLSAGRKDLAKDNQRETFVQALECFCKEYGLAYVEELRQGEKLDRYERIIKAAVEPVGRYFKSNPEELPNIFKGLVSGGHTNARKGKSLSAQFQKVTKKAARKAPSLTSAQNQKPPKKERRMIHINVGHTKEGQPRHELRKQQRGLTVELEEGSIEHGLKWRSRVAEGAIFINISHPDWGLITDRSNSAAVEYTQALILKEISRAELSGITGKLFHEHFEMSFMPNFMRVHQG